MTILTKASNAHRAWAEERQRLFGGKLEVFDELDDDATVPWVEAARVLTEPVAREDEPIEHELEVPLRPRTSASGKVLKPEPPARINLRRSLAKDEIAVLVVANWQRNLQRIHLCSGLDPMWVERLSGADLDLLDGLLWCGWRSLQGDMYGVWVEHEQARQQREFELLEHPEGVNPPTIPSWEEVVAAEDQATISTWREAAYAAAVDGDSLQLMTPGFEPLVWRRPIEAGDLVQMRRFPSREEGCLEIAARVCQVERTRLLELHYDDYERVEMWVVERLGKYSMESEPNNGPTLSQKLRRYSARRKPWRQTSPS